MQEACRRAGRWQDHPVRLLEPRTPVPVGFGQTRRAWVVVAELGYSRAAAGSLVFSKEAPDLLARLARCLWLLGGLPQMLGTDLEGSLHAGGWSASAEVSHP